MALQVKTRGDASPQGKSRVYFCCHPLDFQAFFETVSDEILAKQNCAVWYVGEDGRDENFLPDLERMNLFVMPVTTRLLTTQNPAMEEFRFAMEHHIPVLPLMQESGLEELFNKKCGDLQFLDKNARDDTAISYDEKLTNYLNSVLIGDELAEQIRAAFDAYIFLSYRKKDRRYAQELMKLIHKNDFCRDIAIWYDEFLTPGENFNDSIREALEKSGLFVLTVTPNVVNEENYIMTTEYPMAQEMEKPVLPAEMAPTDRGLLSEKYPGISGCTDAHDDPAMTAALLDAVRSLAIRENDKDPRHNFFMGLAYLTGIDVEVNHDRAVALITSAAEAGLIEAVTKLTEMYREGLGVERNYETAIYWQERKIALLEALYQAEPSEANCHDLCWACMECGDWNKERGKLKSAKGRYAQAGACTKNYLEERFTTKIKRCFAASLMRLGEVYEADGDLSRSEQYYEMSLSALKQLNRIAPTAFSYRDLATAYEKMGRVYQAWGHPDDALRYYESAANLFEKLVEEYDTVGMRQGLAGIYNLLGDMAHTQNALAEAERYYERMLALTERVAQEVRTTDAYSDLSISYNRMGTINETQGNLAKARAYYEKGFALDEQMVQKYDTVTARRALSISCEKLGGICLDEGRLNDAKRYYQKTLELRLKLADEVKTAEIFRDISVAYAYLGEVYEMEDDLPAAKKHYMNAVTIREKLMSRTQAAKAREDLAVSYTCVGRMCQYEGDLSAARTYYEKAFALFEKLSKETGELYTGFAVSCSGMGEVCQDQGDIKGAERYYKEAYALFERMDNAGATLETRRNLAICCQRLGDLYRRARNGESARRYYERAVAIGERLVKEASFPQLWDELASSYRRCACVSSSRRQYLQKAAEIYRMLCRQCPEVADYWDELSRISAML